MSLQLLIFRHAKSGWDAASDHQRVLTDRGQQQAMFMGELLKEKAIQPELVLCSSASRAKETMELAMRAGEWDCDSSIMDALYETNAADTLQLIRQLNANDKIVMLVGHEPTWSELGTELTGKPMSFSTAGMACIKFDTEQWSEVDKGSGQLIWYEHP